MSAPSTEIVTFRMAIADAYDGVLRVLIDAQRFGLDLVALQVQPGGDGGELTIALSSAAPIDRHLLAVRFARHQAVLCVDGVPDGDAVEVRAA